jgi:3',5'-cyclic AMP phosphodiesterase CpdA
MRIAVFTDTHITLPGQTVQGIDTFARLRLATDAVRRFGPDADLCVVMGDLVEDFDPAAYTHLIDGLSDIPVPVRLMMGNHDHRGMLRAAWPALDDDGHGFVQAVHRNEDGMLLFLDTATFGSHDGHYCEQRQVWLRERLAEAGDTPILAFMHHPPFPLGTWADRSMQRDHAALMALLRQGNVRHIMSGHTHRAASGSWDGIGFTVLHGLGPQNALRWGQDQRPDMRPGPSHFAVVDFAAGNVVIHIDDISGAHPSVKRVA